MIKGVVYLAKNKLNGKVYIGQTVQSLSDRKCKHRNDAACGSSSYFGRALRRYGLGGFDWRIVCTVESGTRDLLEAYLNVSEQVFVSQYRSNDRRVGYNCTIGGGGSIGFKHTEESKRKMREAHMGLGHTEKTRKKMSESHTGKAIHSIDGRKRMSEAKTGVKNPMFGKQFSKVHRQRLSAFQKGKHVSMETCRKQSESMKQVWKDKREGRR